MNTRFLDDKGDKLAVFQESIIPPENTLLKVNDKMYIVVNSCIEMNAITVIVKPTKP